ncbi:hypothetical protein M758_3G187400 [Ceratodon purpureus]|uniref:Uncharacterized protein n=1 Tax=Ceratodon purpureus TaxID=3225 RepID=A0A8T0ILL0_CERPU|nr:hypothetical protein KC19_3G188600 [Ceratodon purpureus]KAG0623608.1 hypothetical protein M758_3G187400 [Ceratodon purpureus]
MAHNDAPSPTVPFVLVSAMVAMAFLPWLRSYTLAVLNALQQVNGAVFLWPLLIILGISLISTYHKWMNPNPSSVYQSRNREWKGGSSTTGDYVLGNQQSDGSGVGLFILLVFALVLIPWR